ncbi:Metallo-dependent hydrolase [Wolfiporia cocos MD-104 SS10]|uniref:Probable guanine deaminase n=1 Tax=Wolfiporia cocos (strain MD-104) TaxID=742152 RepID=A0A2H3JPA3_WOLCO|nr:Metallo-dependent hydrolase [Wolfiporia cocos MD-104 SS10]
MPGFIDTHTHAPQMPNIGSGQQYELLDWLAEVTFPMEARFADVNFAQQVYGSVVRRIIDCGTTTCCYYGTLHLDATKKLADIVYARGQRAFVGKCNMVRNSPEYYIEPSTEASLTATRELISYIRALPLNPRTREPLVRPILTPRFALSCTHELLSSLGSLARANLGLAIQTHVSENASEIAFTKRSFPAASLPAPPVQDAEGAAARETYAGVYDAFGLLRGNTVLAHAVHLENSEVELIKARGAGISHCPTSNFNLRSGCAKVGMLLDRGVKVGLGTDVSGGFSPSILRTVQDASVCSKVVAFQHQPSKDELDPDVSAQNDAQTQHRFANRQLPVATLLHLATLGGAQVCNLAARVGSLAPGKAFDALVVSVRSDAGNPAVWGAELDAALGVGASGGETGMKGGRVRTATQELEGMLERFLFCGDDRNIRRVYVQGRLIGGKEFEG